MTISLDDKLVLTVSSSALFDLSESDKVFQEDGIDIYREFQKKNIDVKLKKGVAFPFIKRILKLNKVFDHIQPIEVILCSKNDPDTGLRVLRSIKEHDLDMSRGIFLSGSSPYPYLPAFKSSLFLSKNSNDVLKAIGENIAAGIVQDSHIYDDEEDNELRIAFDFDGVIADDESEKVYQNTNLENFKDHETKFSNIPHNPGPLKPLLEKIVFLQKLENERKKYDPNYQKIIKTSIITARDAPAHERLVTTLKSWELEVNETFFLGGFDKGEIVKILKPHIFFDDQISHLKSTSDYISSVHIPFGTNNKSPKD